MNIQIIYDSNHGHAKKVAESFNQKIYHVNDIFEIYEDFVVFICPTYGDEELPDGMEKFMLNLKLKINFIQYANWEIIMVMMILNLDLQKL